jgi:hypothetical protein
MCCEDANIASRDPPSSSQYDITLIQCQGQLKDLLCVITLKVHIQKKIYIIPLELAEKLG